MRILEPEVMMSEDEVLAYDELTRKYLRILHAGFVETVINMSPASGNFLDVGTGTGWIAIGVAKHTSDIRVTGVDLSDAMLNVARKNAQEEGVSEKTDFVKGDAKGLPFPDQSFDAVFCHNMLHHVPQPELLVSEMKRVVKKNGALIIRDLKRHSRLVTFLHVNILGATYTPLMKKEYSDSILASLSESEWQELLQKSGIAGATITNQFITHQTIEHPASQRRGEYVEVPVPAHIKPIKGFYVSGR